MNYTVDYKGLTLKNEWLSHKPICYDQFKTCFWNSSVTIGGLQRFYRFKFELRAVKWLILGYSIVAYKPFSYFEIVKTKSEPKKIWKKWDSSHFTVNRDTMNILLKTSLNVRYLEKIWPNSYHSSIQMDSNILYTHSTLITIMLKA